MALIKKIANWGNYPTVEASLTEFDTTQQVQEQLSKTPWLTIRGTGLSYGDASLSKNILSTLHHNKLLQFNEATGVITVEAGMTMDEVLNIIVPKGWFLPVTPGTKFITIGGAVAGDVHGKNHHIDGSFCHFVTRMDVMMADGQLTWCSREHNADLFKTICGGLGLSAIILTVEFRLKKINTSYIHQKNIIIRNLDEMLERLQEFQGSTYSVSWIDCLAGGSKLGRGVLMLGEHAELDEIGSKEPLKVHTNPRINVPFFFPSFLLNSLTVGAFNTAFFTKNSMAKKDFIVHYDPYFYPLDFLRYWNKLYGRRGFLQYQFVIPFETSAVGMRKILKAISDSGRASFLAVLKALGESENTLSFPMPGFTLAMDFPVSDGIFPFLDELDKMVIDLGGRIYLVKDARMKPETYWKGYPNAQAFKDDVKRFDPLGKFSSSLSQRLNMI